MQILKNGSVLSSCVYYHQGIIHKVMGLQIQIRPGINTLHGQEPDQDTIGYCSFLGKVYNLPHSHHTTSVQYIHKETSWWHFEKGRLCILILSDEYLQVKDLLWLNYKQRYLFVIGKSARGPDHERQRAKNGADVGANERQTYKEGCEVYFACFHLVQPYMNNDNNNIISFGFIKNWRRCDLNELTRRYDRNISWAYSTHYSTLHSSEIV